MAALMGFTGFSKSLDMFNGLVEGTFCRNPYVSWDMSWFPVDFPLDLSIDIWDLWLDFGSSDKCQWPFKNPKDLFPMSLTLHILSLSLSISLSISLSLYLYLSLSLSIYLSYPVLSCPILSSQSICQSINLSIFQSIYPSIHPSIYIYIYTYTIQKQECPMCSHPQKKMPVPGTKVMPRVICIPKAPRLVPTASEINGSKMSHNGSMGIISWQICFTNYMIYYTCIL